jgi:hypothetical protein
LTEQGRTTRYEEGFKCKPLSGFTMRRTAVLALFLVAMLLVPVQAGDVSVQQQDQEDLC